jgi:hypothetical protein
VGWIRLDRKIVENQLWQDKPFSKGQAWIDLILMANHKDNTFVLGEEVVTVERGSFITSELKLMDRWGWSKSKLRSYLFTLELQHMIVKKTDHKKTTITIVNYGVYQDCETTEEPKKDQKKTKKEPKKDTNKEVTNTNNNIKTYSNVPALNEAILSFIEFRKGIKSPMTEKAIDLMIKELNKLSANTETQIAIINQSIMRGWKGVFALKEDVTKPKPKQNSFNQFPQRTYSEKDYAELEKKLINKGL